MTIIPFPTSGPMPPSPDLVDPGMPMPMDGNLAMQAALSELNGGMLDLGGPQVDALQNLDLSQHDENLAETLPPEMIDKIGQAYLEMARECADSQRQADELLAKGIEEMGLDRGADARNIPFQGASAVVHPMLALAAVDGQARAIRELMPPGGPCKTQIIGRVTPEKEDKANRVKEFMNYQLSVDMPEYRDEMEKLLLMTMLAGSQFKKVWWDRRTQRPRTAWVYGEDIVVPYSATVLDEEFHAERLKMSSQQVRMNVITGLWRDVGLVAGSDPEVSRSQSVVDRITGSAPDQSDRFKKQVIWETYPFIDLSEWDSGGWPDELKGTALPYILTIDDTSGKVLSMRRNWRVEDHLMRKRLYHVHYPMIPWRGFKSLGMLQLIGGLSKTATGALRALLDSAMINNMPAGLRLRGGGVNNTQNRVNIEPLGFAEIDSPGVDDIAKVAMPLPFNPPSTVLFSLLGSIAEMGTRFASVVNVPQDMPANAPVGTTLAHIEQGSIVFSGVHARLQAAQGRELRLIHDLNGENLDDAKIVETFGGELIVSTADFDRAVDVVPAADPFIFSAVQRAAQAEAKKALAAEAKQMGIDVDMRQVFTDVARSHNLPGADQMFPEPQQAVPLDPTGELIALASGAPVQAFPGQDHSSHIRFLMARASDPRYLPIMPMIGERLQALVMNHAVLMSRAEIEQQTGRPLPPPGQPVPPEIDAAISSAAAEVAERMSRERQAEAANGQPDALGMDQMAQVAALDVRRKTALDEATISTKLEEIKSRERQAASEIIADQQIEREKIASRERIERGKMQAGFVKQLGAFPRHAAP